MSIPDSTFEQNFAFFNNFLVKKSVRVISSLYCCHNLVARHYRLGGKILTAFIRCLVIYVKPCPIISQTIGRSAVIPRALTDLLTYWLTYPLARHFELAWAGNICNELLWRKLKLIGIFFVYFYIQLNIGLAALLEGSFYARLHQKLLRRLHSSDELRLPWCGKW